MGDDTEIKVTSVPPDADLLAAPGSVFRAFRRRYLLVQKVAHRLTPGNVSFDLHVEGNRGSSKVSVPDRQQFIELATVMRPLLDPRSETSLWAVWKCLQSALDPGRLNAIAASVEGAFKAIEQGPVAWLQDGRHMNWAELYEIVARGEFFEEDESAAAFLAATNHPIAKGMLAFQFFSFHDAAMKVAALLFSILEDDHVIDQTPASVEEGPCIFCKRMDGGFTAEEHVLPESLIGHDTTLPRGMVCDRCNNGPLATADKALAESALLAVQRVVFLPHTKKGKTPTAHLPGMTIRKMAPRRIRIDEHGRRVNVSRDYKSGQVHLKLTIPVRKDWVGLGRGLFKTALELVALHEGRERALDERFDRARRFVLDGGNFYGHLIIVTKGVPRPQAEAKWWPTEGAALFYVNLYGLHIFFSLDERRDIPTAEAEALGAVVLPLYDAEQR